MKLFSAVCLTLVWSLNASPLALPVDTPVRTPASQAADHRSDLETALISQCSRSVQLQTLFPFHSAVLFSSEVTNQFAVNVLNTSAVSADCLSVLVHSIHQFPHIKTLLVSLPEDLDTTAKVSEFSDIFYELVTTKQNSFSRLIIDLDSIGEYAEFFRLSFDKIKFSARFTHLTILSNNEDQLQRLLTGLQRSEFEHLRIVTKLPKLSPQVFAIADRFDKLHSFDAGNAIINLTNARSENRDSIGFDVIAPEIMDYQSYRIAKIGLNVQSWMTVIKKDKKLFPLRNMAFRGITRQILADADFSQVVGAHAFKRLELDFNPASTLQVQDTIEERCASVINQANNLSPRSSDFWKSEFEPNEDLAILKSHQDAKKLLALFENQTTRLTSLGIKMYNEVNPFVWDLALSQILAQAKYLEEISLSFNQVTPRWSFSFLNRTRLLKKFSLEAIYFDSHLLKSLHHALIPLTKLETIDFYLPSYQDYKQIFKLWETGAGLAFMLPNLRNVNIRVYGHLQQQRRESLNEFEVMNKFKILNRVFLSLSKPVFFNGIEAKILSKHFNSSYELSKATVQPDGWESIYQDDLEELEIMAIERESAESSMGSLGRIAYNYFKKLFGQVKSE